MHHKTFMQLKDEKNFFTKAVLICAFKCNSTVHHLTYKQTLYTNCFLHKTNHHSFTVKAEKDAEGFQTVRVNCCDMAADESNLIAIKSNLLTTTASLRGSVGTWEDNFV